MSTLPDLPELVLDLAAPGTRLVHPARDDYAATAQRLAAALATVGVTLTVTVELVDGTVAEGTGPLIVLGNLMESAVVRRLYWAAYDFTDWAFPGPGGWALRTIRDPFGTGAPVLLVGGSDGAGVAAAAERLVARVRRDGARLGYFNDVQLGRWTTAEQLSVADYLQDDDAGWQRVGQSGSWDYIDNISKCGTGYLRTGDERYLALFQRELRRFIATDVFRPNLEAPPMLHGRMYVLLTVWDLVRDHPQFDAAGRREVDAMFLHVARSGEGTAHIREVAATRAVRYNHHTRAGLDAFFVGRYFARRFALPEAREWLAVAEQLFAPQLASAKPACDSWGHQWGASLFNTLVYALATGRTEYFASRAFRDGADRALLAYGRGAPRRYLAACAVATGDSGYLSQERGAEAFATESAQLRLEAGQSPLVNFTDEVLRTFTGHAAIVRRADLLGQALAPLDGLWRETIENETYNPGGIFVVNVPAVDAFDKIALRDGWAEEDFYLLVDGISGGHHAYQDANCLVWLRERGVDWLLPRPGYWHALGPRQQNGVNLVVNGRGAGCMARYARLLYRGTQGDFSATGTAITGVGEADWQRHILRKRGAWTLVIDRAVSRVAGEVLMERFWFPQGAGEPGADGFTCRQTKDGVEQRLNFASLAQASCGECGAPQPMERVRGRVEAGGALTLAGLLWCGEKGAWVLTAAGDAWCVKDAQGDAITEIVLVKQGLGLTVKVEGSRWSFGDRDEPATVGVLALKRPGIARAVEGNGPYLDLFREWQCSRDAITAVTGGAAGERVVATKTGEVMHCDPEGRERWRVRLPGRVTALELSAGDVVVGEDSGAVTLLGQDGTQRWRVEIPWVTLPWAYWGEQRSSVRELAVADLDGDGAEEILVSNADRRVYAFDRAGREWWKRAIEWGVFTAMWPDGHEGKFALFGGTSRPSIHGYAVRLGGDGAVRGHFQRSDLTCWSMPSALRDLWRGDIDGDGGVETVTALDTNCRQLVAYAANGALKWDLDVGGAAGALAVDPAARRVFCAADAGYVVAVDGAAGRRVWGVWIGAAANLLWVLADGRLLAVAPSGRGWVISAAGAVEQSFEVGSAITAVPRPGNHRAAGRNLILGTADGRVLWV